MLTVFLYFRLYNFLMFHQIKIAGHNNINILLVSYQSIIKIILFRGILSRKNIFKYIHMFLFYLLVYLGFILLFFDRRNKSEENTYSFKVCFDLPLAGNAWKEDGILLTYAQNIKEATLLKTWPVCMDINLNLC